MPYEPLKLTPAAQIFYGTYPKLPSPVERILPASLTVLSGDSKIGKSWLVLWLALQISQGLPVWGIPTEKQDVIYLAIEDNDQRLQKRMHRLVDVPPPNLYISYSSGCIGEELEELFEATKDRSFSLLIQMTAFYGLRRSEVLGLKWDAVDFERETLTIEHTVTEAKVRGKRGADQGGQYQDQVLPAFPTAGGGIQGEADGAETAAAGKHADLRGLL